MKKLTLRTSISIHASLSEVWEALINPQQIKKYLFGTEVISGWKENSPITYKGEYNGKKYEDKGIIKKIEPNEILQSTYWSSMSGKEDKPENYAIVTYKLSRKEDKSVLTLTQDNIDNQEAKEHSLQNWKTVLRKLKEVVENKE